MPQKRPSTVISEQSERMPFALNGNIKADLYDLFVSMQESTYPPEKRYHLACPFWKFHPREYRHVRNSNCLFWGFRDIGELNEHIQRRHCKGKQSKSADKGDHVPTMNSKQEAKWRSGNWKKAGSTESKWWKIAKAVTGYSMPEEERPDDFHYHFPGPDIYLIQRFESFRLTGSEDNSSQEDERPAADVSVFARPRRSRTSRSNRSGNWAVPNPRSSDTLSPYAEEDEADDEPAALYTDPFNSRQEPSRYCIPRGSDSAYHSYEDGHFVDSSGGFLGQGQYADLQLGNEYTATAVDDFLGAPSMESDMFAGMQYPLNLDEEDLLNQ